VEISNIRELKDYQKEEYGFYRYYVKRDILRRISFSDYKEFITELKGYAKSNRATSIDIIHIIHYDGKQFNVRFQMPATFVPNLLEDENLFTEYTVTTYYEDDNEYPLINYIKKKRIDNYIKLI